MENKEVRYTVRMTESEKKELELKSWKENIKLSEYVRNKLFDKTIAAAPKEIDLAAELEKIKDKYIVKKFKEKKNPFESMKIGEKINLIDEIIKEL